MKEFEFSTSLLFFWVKGKVEVDNRFVKTKLSNTLLGFIPAGKDQQSIPLKIFLEQCYRPNTLSNQ